MRAELLELIHKYSTYVDDRRMPDVVNLFIDSGTVTVTGKVVTNGKIEMKGHVEIAAWLARLTAGGGPVGKHFLSNTLIDDRGDHATAQTDMMFIKQGSEGRRWEVFELARYYDQFVRTADGWRFSSRLINIFP